MSSYGAKGTRTPNNRLRRTVRYAARRCTGAMGYVPDLHKIWVGTSDQPPYRAHQAACRLIVETDDGNFWGSGLQPHIRTHDFLALSICAVLPLPP